MITAEIIQGKNVPKQLRERGERFESAVAQTVLRLAIKMQGLVKQKLSDDVLKVKSGRLRRSINYSISNQGNLTTAIVGTNVVYAAIHEFGGSIPAHTVFPKTRQALKFSMDGKIVFAKRANVPTIKMPKRSFLQSSLEQMTPEIRDTLIGTVNRVLRGTTA
jgi:phage gpG-like protein